MENNLVTSDRSSAQSSTAYPSQNGEATYAIDFDAIEQSGRSAAFMVRSRLCWQCSQVAEERDEGFGTLEEHLETLQSDCSQRPDYLLPGTPLTEAVFRIMLSSGNRAMKIREIQDHLSSAWASVIYMKDLSEDLLTRLLDSENVYMIKRVSD